MAIFTRQKLPFLLIIIITIVILLDNYNEMITITEFSLVSLVIDYNETIIISKNGD